MGGEHEAMSRNIRTKVGIRATQNYVTWGQISFDKSLCIELPEYGYIRRDYEPAVLPHAIGCQAPTHIDEYIAILKGQHGFEFIISIDIFKQYS